MADTTLTRDDALAAIFDEVERLAARALDPRPGADWFKVREFAQAKGIKEDRARDVLYALVKENKLERQRAGMSWYYHLKASE